LSASLPIRGSQPVEKTFHWATRSGMTVAIGDVIIPPEKEEILRIRHHSLYVPRDFDISPYFAIVKPNLAHGFDYRKLRWAETLLTA
jgi:hypothetical protein